MICGAVFLCRLRLSLSIAVVYAMLGSYQRHSKPLPRGVGFLAKRALRGVRNRARNLCCKHPPVLRPGDPSHEVIRTL